VSSLARGLPPSPPRPRSRTGALLLVSSIAASVWSLISGRRLESVIYRSGALPGAVVYLMVSAQFGRSSAASVIHG
jgi:hypothetical protein